MNPKEKAILERITHLEDAIDKGREYIETGAHADWHGFRPLFVDKVRDGKVLPPHKDWVKNAWLPYQERKLRKLHTKLETLTQKDKDRRTRKSTLSSEDAPSDER